MTAPAPAVQPVPPARRAAGGRRELSIAIIGCLAGAALVLLAVSATWIHLRVGTGSRTGTDGAAGPTGLAVAAAIPVRLGGGTVAPAVTGFGLVGLAGVVAIAATRSWGRTVVGALVLAAGIGVVIAAGRIGADPTRAARGATPVRQIAPDGVAVLRDVTATMGPWLACAGGVLLAASGLLVALRGRAWSTMSARYDAPAARPVNPWDEIERGGDPT
ncbi:MAG: Trp biosynthesis-associated membrane protein [Frankia sp.]